MFALEKIEKIYDSLKRCEKNYKYGNGLAAMGDLDFVKENAQEAIYIIMAEMKDSGK